MNYVEVFETIETADGAIYNPGHHLVTTQELIDMTGETEDTFFELYESWSRNIDKAVFNQDQCDIKILN